MKTGGEESPADTVMHHGGEESPADFEQQSEEVAVPKAVRSPLEPTNAEVDEHELLGHVQFRSWCRHCVAARGVGQQHRSQAEEPEGALPTVSSDYCYMSQTDEETMPIIVIRDRRTKAYAATTVKAKGNDEYAVKFFAGFLQQLGYQRFINKSDNERSLVALKTKAVESLPGVEAVPKESPEGDHQANGEAEAAVREVKRQVRVMKSSLDEKLGFKLTDSDPILAWLLRHAADLLTRYIERARTARQPSSAGLASSGTSRQLHLESEL